MRPSACLGVGLLGVIVAGGVLASTISVKRGSSRADWAESRVAVEAFGLSDLAVSTEARYTRHPAVSDQLVPFMDHPDGLEHFPSGAFFVPVRP